MSNTDDVEQQIREMAKLTMLSNQINPIQEKNLKMYPMVFFNGVNKVRADFDLSTNQTGGDRSPVNSSYVHYYLDIDESVENPAMSLRFDHLEHSVRSLFWNNVRVKVFFNGKTVFESKK